MEKEQRDIGGRKLAAEAGLPVVECFYSLQGEGFHSGWPAFFIRLAGCRNACAFCDTKESWDEAGYPLHSPEDLRDEALSFGASACVVTGGEPMLHDLDALCGCLRKAGFRLWLETSGSEPMSGSWDWICLSPKKGIPVVDKAWYDSATELKVVIESEADFAFAEAEAGKVCGDCVCFLQAEWGMSQDLMPVLLDYILRHPRWKLSLQTHKILGVR